MKSESLSHPKWMSYVLYAAAIYNILWGAWVVLIPNAYFNLAGMQLPVYPEIWQCVGMVVGVYGVGYAIAGLNPYRHWPIVLVGFLGKVFGPIGFVKAIAIDQTFTWKAGLNTITNDLIWWVPFALILLGAYRHWKHGPGAP